MLENNTKLISNTLSSSFRVNFTLSSTSTPIRTRIMINAIYIAGIAFMVGIFLLLLWVNLCSQHCWCWHDTPVSNRFSRPWFIRRSVTINNNDPSKEQQQQIQLNNDELE